MHTNGTIVSKPFAKLGDIAPTPLTGKPPQVWGTALELCRKAVGWSQKQLIAEAFKGDPNEPSLSDIKRWELAREPHPTLNQCNKLRQALPTLRAYEHLLRLALREDPSKWQKAAPLAPLAPPGWKGPPVKTFGDALKWCRIKSGMVQAELGAQVGVRNGAISQWEYGARVVRGTYEVLCQIFANSGLDYAPKPEFSVGKTNQIKTVSYLEAQERRREQARAEAALEPTTDEPRVAKPTRASLSDAPLNTLGAQYGVLRARVIGLRAELRAIELRHHNEVLAHEEKIKAAEADVSAAETKMDEEAHAMHGGTP